MHLVDPAQFICELPCARTSLRHVAPHLNYPLVSGRRMGESMKITVHTAFTSLLLVGSAAGADLRMPTKAPPPAAPAVTYNWTGCYVGAGGGYGMFNQGIRARDAVGPVGLSNDVGGRGWFGTVQVGCDYQIGATIVVGAFADYDFSSIKGDWSHTLFGSVGEEKLKGAWAAGGRVGWLPYQQLLVFVSGGYTQARFDAINLVPAVVGALSGFSLDEHTYSGWFVGAGYEYGIAFLPGLFWKSEYRFADYGSENVRLRFLGGPTGFSFDQHKRVQTVRSELVWRFNPGGGPVPAPVKAPSPVAPAIAYNWTGCYVGAGGGYGMFDQEVRAVNAPNSLGLSNDVGGRGWFGTIQAGCDYQIGANIVIGAFADYDFGDIEGNWSNISFSFVGEEKLKSSWAAGGRIGWLPSQQLLVFVSGGYTEARFGTINLLVLTSGLPSALSIDKHAYSGAFIGTGYEYGIAFLPGLFWKTEYRFADYGTENVPELLSGVPTGVSFDQHKYVQTVRSELVWRFNFGGSPVVARF
jgi:outer membrane immunogenic protein